MEIALKMVAQICFPVNKLTTTNHRTQRATNLRPAFHPGGVAVSVAALAVLMATWAASWLAAEVLLWISEDILWFLLCLLHPFSVEEMA
jgi:hypothetical protein